MIRSELSIDHLATAPFYSRGLKCEDVKCDRNFKNPGRVGAGLANAAEIPYIVMLHDWMEKRPFCLGVLLSFSAVLTTCKCVHRFEPETRTYVLKEARKILMAVRGVNINAAYLQKRVANSIKLHPNSKVEIENDGFDFAVLKFLLPLLREGIETIYIRSLSTLQDETQRMLSAHQYCLGFGFGSYGFLASSDKEGIDGDQLLKYDINLVSDHECNNGARLCCGTWRELFGGQRISRIEERGLSCAKRAKPKSLCFGNTGSPIVCNNYVIGLLKGRVKCKDAGGFEMILMFYRAQTFIRMFYRPGSIFPSVVPPLDDFKGQGDFSEPEFYEGLVAGGPKLRTNGTEDRGKSGNQNNDVDSEYYSKSFQFFYPFSFFSICLLAGASTLLSHA